MADIQDAVTFLQQANDAESENRQLAMAALRFRYGEQWPQYAIASRGLDRPQLTINETNTYIKKITNAQRQQRPRGKASPVDDKADIKVAKVITGIGRHVEVNSDADNAYDTAFDFAATGGFGYWRLRTDYISDDSMNQDIFIDVVDNPFTVYFDWNSKLPDGSDAEKALITDLMPKEAFKQAFPGAQLSGFTERGSGDTDPDWASEHEIRIAEYMYVERTRDKLIMLTNGELVWASEMARIQKLLVQMGIGIKGDRDSYRRVVRWQKQTAFEILEKKDIPGKYIPVVPMYWTRVWIDGKRYCYGLVKDAMDPARMNNFWQTAITEALALAPKAKWLLAEGQDEGHEKEFSGANINPSPVLRYKQTDVDGRPAPPPQRVAPEMPPSGFIEAAFMANQNLSRVMGIYDPAVRGGAQHKSDKTLNAEQNQSENTNYDGYDNLLRSIKHTWRIILGWVPYVYDTQRVQRIIGDDGREELVTLNEQKTEHGEDGQAVQKVLNDMTVGTYDVIMETGPGYDSRRREGVAATMELMNTPIGEKIAATADDLIIRQMDFPGADMIADRLAAANPLSQIDEKDEVPPRIQMMVKGLQAELQKAGQANQMLQAQLKYRSDVESMKQEGETKRELMRVTAKAHDVNERNLSMQHSTETKALTAQNVAEINGLVQLLKQNGVNTHEIDMFMRQVQATDAEQQTKLAEDASAAA